MIAVPVRREPAPLTTRPAASRAPAQAAPEAPAHDPSLAEALAKVKTPADDAVAKQQAAFDQLMQLRTENEREANAIREFGIAQAKKEADFLSEYIRMI
jgi:hypothetical protein